MPDARTIFKPLHLRISVAGATAMLFWTIPAKADAGVPMLMLVWPASWVVFIPIVIVEGMIARSVLGASYREGMKLSLLANTWSTLAGIPLTWVVLLVPEFLVGGIFALTGTSPGKTATLLLVPLMAPWVGGSGFWEVLAAAAFLCLPFMYVSILIEQRVARRRYAAQLAKRWAVIANFVSYGPIILLLCTTAAVAYFRSW